MTSISRSCILLAAGCLATLGEGPAAAQSPDYQPTIRAMRNCAKIVEVESRAACYDRTIAAAPADAAEGASPAVKAESPSPKPPTTTQPGGFGSESLPSRSAEEERRPADFTITVNSARERVPGIYLLNLQDGSQWQMVDPAPPSYDPPRQGSTIVISRGALGSFYLNYQRQRPLRVKRIR